MRRRVWLEEKRRESQHLGEVELQRLVPSRRDFFQFTATHKRGVAVIVRLKRRDPFTRGAWPDVDLIEMARAADEADAGAVAFCTAGVFGGTSVDLSQGAAVVTAPVLCDDLCLDAKLVYQARLGGADAVVIPAGELSAAAVADLVDVAASLHMASVVEVGNARELSAALCCAHAAIGLNCMADDGFILLDSTRELAAQAPPRRIAIVLAEPRNLEEIVSLSGAIDAAVLGDIVLSSADPASTISAAVERLR